MKQHITVEQLNELSEKGKKRLQKWWKPKNGDFVVFKQINAQEEFLLTGIDDNHASMLWFCPSEPTDSSYASGKSKIVENEYAVAIVDGNNDEYAEYHKYSEIKNILPLLSIGQMIEFLDEHYKWKKYFSMTHHGLWSIIDGSYTQPLEGRCAWGKGELCDALWIGVKEVLEKP